MATQELKHNRWSSKFVFILAATGAAVGLGNIWKFPYEVASNGGSAFVITYIICLACLGIPLLIAEMLLGRLGRANPIATLSKLAKENNTSQVWAALGWLNIITLICVLSFYSVVAGWSIKYFVASCMGVFVNIDNNSLNLFWQNTVANPVEIISYHALFMLLTIAVVIRGVNRGIETANKILMPLLFIFLLMLVGYSYTTPGFEKGWNFLFEFRYQDINFDTIIKAFGQTCFTLAIGAGCMLVYGSYVTDETNLGETSYIIALVNLLVAVLIGLAIFPLIFSYGLTPIGGPGLIFQTIPIAFAKMKFGHLFGSLFFALILFAAWTSSISMAEPVVIMLVEKHNLTRAKAGMITGTFTWLLGILSALSFNVWQDVHILGYNNFFTLITDVTTDFMLPIGILGFAIFSGWKVRPEAIIGGLNFKKQTTRKIWLFLIKYPAPIAVLSMLIWHGS